MRLLRCLWLFTPFFNIRITATHIMWSQQQLSRYAVKKLGRAFPFDQSSQASRTLTPLPHSLLFIVSPHQNQTGSPHYFRNTSKKQLLPYRHRHQSTHQLLTFLRGILLEYLQLRIIVLCSHPLTLTFLFCGHLYTCLIVSLLQYLTRAMSICCACWILDLYLCYVYTYLDQVIQTCLMIERMIELACKWNG